MPDRNLPDSMRLHNAAAAFTTAREHILRGLAELEGIEVKGAADAQHYARLAALQLDDSLEHVQFAYEAARKLERLMSASGLLEALDAPVEQRA